MDTSPLVVEANLPLPDSADAILLGVICVACLKDGRCKEDGLDGTLLAAPGCSGGWHAGGCAIPNRDRTSPFGVARTGVLPFGKQEAGLDQHLETLAFSGDAGVMNTAGLLPAVAPNPIRVDTGLLQLAAALGVVG